VACVELQPGTHINYDDFAGPAASKKFFNPDRFSAVNLTEKCLRQLANFRDSRRCQASQSQVPSYY
jgi:hypothetical protein